MTGTRGSLVPDERRRMIAERLRGARERVGRRARGRVRHLADDRAARPRRTRGRGVASRTHGGAVLPGLSSHEDSFLQRLEVAVDAKERLAAAALALLEPGEAIFVDSSTTGYFAARRVVRENLRCTLLTNSVPVMDLCTSSTPRRSSSSAPAAALRKLTRSLVGAAGDPGDRGALRRPRDLLGPGAHTGRLPHRPGPARGGGQARDDQARPAGRPTGRRIEVRSSRAGSDRRRERGRRDPRGRRAEPALRPLVRAGVDVRRV